MSVSLNQYTALIKGYLCEIMAYNMELDQALESTKNVIASSDVIQSLATIRSLNFAYAAELRWANLAETTLSSLPTDFQRALSECHRKALLEISLSNGIGQEKSLHALMDQMAESLAFDPLEPLYFNDPSRPDVALSLADIESGRRAGKRKMIIDQITVKTFLLPYYVAGMIWIKPSEASNAAPDLR